MHICTYMHVCVYIIYIYMHTHTLMNTWWLAGFAGCFLGAQLGGPFCLPRLILGRVVCCGFVVFGVSVAGTPEQKPIPPRMAVNGLAAKALPAELCQRKGRPFSATQRPVVA